uniref:CP2 domain-containing protein n=1 Tax=Ganoderma boninense TaxID=34458 RepID=A0A5K1JZK7_9APHY|nr:CP2 domain-containing protein [Ganoderma boninense]
MLVAGRKLSVKRLQGGLLRLHSKFVEFLRANPQLEEVHLVDPEWPRRPGAPEPVLFESLELPDLHTLACNHLIMAPIKNPRNITRLHVVEDDSDWDVIRDVVRIFGAQLISLRVDFYHSLGVLPKSKYHYPTLREYRWEGCPRLKFLHIDDKPLSLILNGKYGVDERKKAKLPPALETLIWGPLRTRYDDRSAIQQFGDAVLRDMVHVREVIYMWSPKEDYFHCSLSTADELRERQTDRREADRMWAEV